MCIATLRASSSEPPRTCSRTPILLRGGCAYAAMRAPSAASMSPFVSCSARLQSIIGAPVWSRSSLTSAAEISAIGLDLFGDRLLSRRHLLVVAFRHGFLHFGRCAVGGRRLREVGRCRLLLSRGDAVGDHPYDQV